jgi:arylsulfatase A-like enzyme
LTPPPGLSDWELDQWLAVSPDEVTVAGRVLRGDALLQWKYDRYMQDYLACVQGIDDNVGRFVEFLDREGLTANTVVIYTSDNGWYLGDLGLYDKRFMYEPGLRVPLIAAGPGITAAKVSDQLVANIDLAPTFLEVAGLPVPDWMQGRSLAPLLRGEMPTDWRTSIYYRYYHDPGHHNTAAHFGVRTATHKLIHYWNKDAWELFDLVVDPHEQHNLLFAPADASRLDVSQQFQDLKAEIERLQILYKDNGQFADPSTWPKSSADGPFNKTPRGTLTVNEAIRLSTSQSSNISR